MMPKMAESFTAPLLPGLFYVDEFLTFDEEEALLLGIADHPRAWKLVNNRSLQNWGGLPHVKGMLPTPLPPFLEPLLEHIDTAGVFHALQRRPNHVLVNRYQPGQGISAHVDGPAYSPVAAIVSLRAPIVMHFFERKLSRDALPDVPLFGLLLRPRSLLVLSGAAYTDVYHAILERTHDPLDHTVLNALPQERGTTLQREERLSCTVRASCRTVSNSLLGRLYHKR